MGSSTTEKIRRRGGRRGHYHGGFSQWPHSLWRPDVCRRPLGRAAVAHAGRGPAKARLRERPPEDQHAAGPRRLNNEGNRLGNPGLGPKPSESMVRLEGFEPPTCCSGGNRSIHLSYRRTRLKVYNPPGGRSSDCPFTQSNLRHLIIWQSKGKRWQHIAPLFFEQRCGSGGKCRSPAGAAIHAATMCCPRQAGRCFDTPCGGALPRLAD